MHELSCVCVCILPGIILTFNSMQRFIHGAQNAIKKKSSRCVILIKHIFFPAFYFHFNYDNMLREEEPSSRKTQWHPWHFDILRQTCLVLFSQDDIHDLSQYIYSREISSFFTIGRFYWTFTLTRQDEIHAAMHTHDETDTPLTFRYPHTSYVRSVNAIMLFSVSRSPATEGFAAARCTRNWPRRHYGARGNRKFLLALHVAKPNGD